MATPMVEYHEWVSIVFAEAKAQGFEASFDENNTVVTVAADVWNDRSAELKTASGSQARKIAGQEVTVS